jgi:hypothetical protein
LSRGRLHLSHDHHPCDLVLVVKHKTVIQIGEDTLQSFLYGQVVEGQGDLFLEQGFVSPEPDSRLLLNVACHVQQRGLFEVDGEQPVFHAHRVSTPNMLLEKENKKRRCNQANAQKRFCGFQNHCSFPEQRESYPAFQAAVHRNSGTICLE